MVANPSHPSGNPEDPKHLRLTLRTLLAYLDDVLEPGPAREIGARIQETPYASQLVDRIQEVLRRRRVAAPDLKGPGSGLDPNTVAEYLDNTLPPKAVPDVERVCLESDMHLAEVAACHQILTLVLGEPIHVSAESRERLHALIPAGLARKSPGPALESQPHPEPHPAKAPAHELVSPAVRQPATSETRAEKPVQPSTNGGQPHPVAAKPSPFSRTIPDYLKPKPLWQRALVPFFVVSVLLLWLALLIYDNSLSGDRADDAKKVAQKEQQTAKGLPPKTASKTDAEETSASVAKKGATENATKIAAVDVKPTPPAPEVAINEPAPPVRVEPMPTPDEPAPAVAEVEAVAKADTQGAKKTVPATPPENTTPGETTSPPMPPKPDTPAVVKQGPQILYTTKMANSVTKGMLLRYDAQDQEWVTLPQRAYIMLDEQLACPEPLDAVFNVLDTDCEVTFVGGVLARFQAATSPAAFALDLSQGKIVFTRSGANSDAEGEKESLLVTLKIGKDILPMEITPNTRCGVEIMPRLPNQFEQGLGANWYTGTMWVQSGELSFLDRNEKPQILRANQSFDLTPNVVAQGEMEPMPPTVQSDQIVPAWLAPEGRTFRSLTAQYVRQFHAAFEEVPLETDVSYVLRPLVRDDETSLPVAVMAAKALTMMGYLQDVADLLAMHESRPEEIRRATIEGARYWLTLHPDKAYGQHLRTALGTNFNQKNEQTADDIYRLLWGYRKSDLQDEATAMQLVNWLDHKNIVVRTLAFMHLTEHTSGQTHKYRPLQGADERKEPIERWRTDVRSGGLFK